LTGQGVKIGIIDTGIDYVHKNFGGSGNYAANTSHTAIGDSPDFPGTPTRPARPATRPTRIPTRWTATVTAPTRPARRLGAASRQVTRRSPARRRFRPVRLTEDRPRGRAGRDAVRPEGIRLQRDDQPHGRSDRLGARPERRS